MYVLYLTINLSSGASNKEDTFSAVNITRYFRVYLVIIWYNEIEIVEQNYRALFGSVFLKLFQTLENR